MREQVDKILAKWILGFSPSEYQGFHMGNTKFSSLVLYITYIFLITK